MGLIIVADPPSDYYYPATDIIGRFDKIKSQASAGGFSSQYEFDLALNELLYSTHDGHLGITTCTSQTIQYRRGLDVEDLFQPVSISQDEQVRMGLSSHHYLAAGF